MFTYSRKTSNGFKSTLQNCNLATFIFMSFWHLKIEVGN